MTRPLQHTIVPRVAGRAFLMMARERVRRWDRALDLVQPVQTRQLLDICGHAKGTEFGKGHGFSWIKSYDDFRQQVPVGDYDTFSPYIERMRRGEASVLVPEFVRYFGNSSGSSVQGKPKFLPITDRQIRQQMGSGLDGLLRYLDHTGDAEFPRGFTLGLFPPTTMREEGPVLITSNPALMAVKKPRISQLMYIPRDRACLEMADYSKKLDLIAETYLDYDVRAIAGTTCWFSLLFDKLLAVAERQGRRATSVADIWPNLRALLGGGVSAGPYREVLRERMGRDDALLVDTYNATEGGVYATTDYAGHAGGRPGEPGEPGLLMIPDRGVFFEFIPAEDYESSSPRRVPLWEVEKDRVYAIVVTTPSGLYAYKIGDLVRFPSLRPLRLEFVGRTSGCLSTTQELTTHAEIESAVAAALRAHPAIAVDFACGADVGVAGTSRSRYVLFVEFAGGHAPADLEGFTSAFDDGLRAANRVYREHRNNEVAILAPEVVSLPPGSVRRFLGEVRRGNVQAKFPRVVDEQQKRVLQGYAREDTN